VQPMCTQPATTTVVLPGQRRKSWYLRILPSTSNSATPLPSSTTTWSLVPLPMEYLVIIGVQSSPLLIA